MEFLTFMKDGIFVAELSEYFSRIFSFSENWKRKLFRSTPRTHIKFETIGASLNERMDEWKTRESFEQEVQGRSLRCQERRTPISHCALSRARNACGHSTSFSRELWEKVDYLDASFQRRKRNTLAISENVTTSCRYRFYEYFQNILLKRALEILRKRYSTIYLKNVS